MNLSHIIKQRRAELGLTLKEVADVVGVSEATIQRYESGEIENPRHNRISKLAEALKVTPEHLMGWDSDKDFDIFSIPNVFPIETKKFPLLGEISCGELKYAEEDFQGYVEAGADIHADFVIRAKGDSMVGAFIRDGDLVFVRQQPAVEHGEIAVVIVDDEATLKRFYQYGDTMVLKAENPSYKDIEVKIDEEHNIRILGKAIAFQSDVR